MATTTASRVMLPAGGLIILVGLGWLWTDQDPGGSGASPPELPQQSAASPSADQADSPSPADQKPPVLEDPIAAREPTEVPPAPPLEVHDDWISRQYPSFLTGKPNLGQLFQALDTLAMRATAVSNGSRGQISFPKDPMTTGSFDMHGNDVRVTLTTRAPPGSALGDRRFVTRFLQFKFERRHTEATFSCQMNLCASTEPMSHETWVDLFGPSMDPVRAGFVATIVDGKSTTNHITLQPRPGGAGGIVPWVVGGDGIDNNVSSFTLPRDALRNWRRVLDIR